MNIDESIARAQTLEARLYADPDFAGQLREGAFARGWHYLGHLGEVEAPGQVVPRVLGAGTLDEPVLLTRDEQGILRGLSNVCTHRGLVMIDRPGVARNIRCGYHGRRFGLDGALRAAPGFEGAEDFPRPCDDLPRISLGQWGPLIFGSLEPAVPFEDWMRPVSERLAFFGPERLVAAPERDRTYPVQAPWIAYCDNYLEGMHIPYVHPGLADALELEDYGVELFEQASLQIGVAKPEESAFSLPAVHPDAGRRVGGYYFFLFPNLMVNLYPWGLSLNVVESDGLDRCRVRFLSFVADASKLDAGASADLHAVEMEDEAVVERVARGLRSRLYRRGRYAPAHEAGVHHFHRLLVGSASSDGD